MAEVFSGHAIGDHGFQKPVAIKRLLPELANDTVFVDSIVGWAKGPVPRAEIGGFTARLGLEIPAVVPAAAMPDVDPASWVSLAALVPLAQKNANVPYEVDGKVKVTKLIQIEVPFKITGEDSTLALL